MHIVGGACFLRSDGRICVVVCVRFRGFALFDRKRRDLCVLVCILFMNSGQYK